MGYLNLNVSRNEQLLDFSGECMDIYYVTFCIVLYASLKYFLFFFLMKGSRYLEIR